jgi:hypothetical protein
VAGFLEWGKDRPHALAEGAWSVVGERKGASHPALVRAVFRGLCGADRAAAGAGGAVRGAVGRWAGAARGAGRCLVFLAPTPWLRVWSSACSSPVRRPASAADGRTDAVSVPAPDGAVS